MFTKKDHLKRHGVRYHEARASGDEYMCDLCDLRFQTRHERELHTRSIDHHARRFQCNAPECGKSYSKREHLKRHVLSVHTPRTTARQDEEEHKDAESNSSKPFWCDLCNIGFAYSHGLVRHQKRSHVNQNKPFECAQCLLAFKKKSDLQAHSYVHTGVMPFECEHCSQRFLKKFHLTRHARTHASHKPAQAQVWFCDEPDCNEMLFSGAEKAQHERDVHHKAESQQQQQKEEEDAAPCSKRKRPQAAAEYPDTSVDADANRRQLLECKICARTFQRKQNLRAHLRTHFEAVDERKLHVCPMPHCANSYTRKSNVMAHYNAVHDTVRSQRFVCPYEGCAGKFGYKKVLQTHIESVHVNPTPAKKKTKQGGWTPMKPKVRILGTTDDDDVNAAVIVITDKEDKEDQRSGDGEDSVMTSSSISKEGNV
uniref:C2H2-type domain-containing protein n=1 Tax=Globisporangium ultimum (strain ATCC 200006 / CBS 805.95 / DAOM BR144) TaxID=431595 RepID=K3XBX4_GLOUD